MIYIEPTSDKELRNIQMTVLGFNTGTDTQYFHYLISLVLCKSYAYFQLTIVETWQCLTAFQRKQIDSQEIGRV